MEVGSGHERFSMIREERNGQDRIDREVFMKKKQVEKNGWTRKRDREERDR